MDKKPVIILGAKGIGPSAAEIFKSNTVEVYCFLDDDKALHGQEIDLISVLGETTDDGYLKYIGNKCDAFVAEENLSARKKAVKMLNDRRKVMPANAIHATAVISDLAHIGYGNFINANVLIGANVTIPNHCILHSGAIVEYNVIVEDFVQIGAGTQINSNVSVGKETFIGSGVTIVSGVKIGKKANIGAGSVVVQDVKDGETVFGNPAKKVAI
ncbi:MAG: sugar O-acyltransferase (sialic acid O-acetyltransferase NeuD family) [Marivirga sp.]|jgi:sugar O-acyltransferase (sialic acid O-acetyltransferase NeuD family)